MQARVWTTTEQDGSLGHVGTADTSTKQDGQDEEAGRGRASWGTTKRAGAQWSERINRGTGRPGGAPVVAMHRSSMLRTGWEMCCHI